jgi:hypothetical protein
MNYLLLAATLSLPMAAFAQQPVLLQGSLNPHGFLLAHPALLYRQLNDTLTSRHVLRLRPGDDVVVQQDHPGWLKVVRGNGQGTGFSADTATYYLPARALKDARRFILL